MKTLGIDFGLKKIGLAITQGSLVEPLVVLENKPSATNKIADLCRGCQVEKIVLGIPESQIVQQVRLFGKNLSRETKLPVVYHPETLTTKEAIAKMVEAGKKRKYRREKKDAYAAALILQKYLDGLNSR